MAVGAAVAQGFGRFTYGVVLPAVRSDLGITNTVAGSIGTVNVGAYLVGTVTVAALSTRLRLLSIMQIGFLFSTSGLALAAFSPNVVVLGVAMFLAGFGGACIWIPAPVIAADAVPVHRRGAAVGLIGSGIGIGVVSASQLAAWVRSTMGDSAWRTVYLVQAAIAVGVLALTLVMVGHSQSRPRPTSAGGFGGFRVLAQMRGWLPLTAAYTSFGFMYLLVIAFLTSRLEDDSGWSSAQASLAFTLLGLAVVVGGPIFIGLGRRVGPRNAMAVAFSGWAVLTLVVLGGWFAPTLLSAIGLGAMFAGVPTMITLYVVENTSADTYGPSFSAATLAFGLAQMASPQVGGVIADLSGSFTPVFVLSSALAVTGLVAALRIPSQPTG